MSPRDFFDLVAKMRGAQREYFNTRSASALGKSRSLEEAVDREISRVLKIMAERLKEQPTQKKIF